ncbi:MAG: leucine-rich repeat domain-containing protein [Oscillospiraceae bacterium]|nr:leucine-rich repeat domain-containing protein [Oscillospiraceae bacterium]
MIKRVLAFFVALTVLMVSTPLVSAETSSFKEVPWNEAINADFWGQGITNEKLAEMVSDGTIPTNVTSLQLGNNQISDLTPLVKLTSMQMLDLDGNDIVDISSLSSLTNLGYLRLGHNQVTDLSPLINLPNLGTGFGGLSLNNNQITDISPLASITNLRWLNLEGNQITDLTPLENLIFLESHFAGLDTLPVSEEQIEHLHETLRQKRASMDRSVLTFGHVLGLEPYTMADALQILRYCVNLPNVIDDDEYGIALEAALIVSEGEPGMADALQVLRYVVKLSSVFDER